jgi:hypothetical protein
MAACLLLAANPARYAPAAFFLLLIFAPLTLFA